MPTILTLSTIISFIAINFLFAICYSLITGKKPASQLSFTEINDNIKSKVGGWIVLIPIVSVLVLLYNVIVNAFFFVGVVFEFIAWLLKWIWVEIIISGGVFIFSIFWHYLIKWPWKLLIHGFTLIKTSLKFSYLIIGTLALFFSLLIMFLGRFSIEIFELPDWSSYGFSLLSIFPIGIGLSWVIQKLANNDYNHSKQASTKYFIHLLYIIGAFAIVIIAQLLLIYIGTFTSLSSFISSIFVGTNLLGSFILILNSIVILFALAALPSFSNTYEGSDKYLLISFIRYLFKNNWGKYIISGPSILFPVVIACLAPFIITQGVSYVSGMISNSVFEFKIQQLADSNNKIASVNYNEWLDINKTSDESLKELKNKDIEKTYLLLSSNNTKSNQSYFNNFYKIHSSEIGAAPVGALIYLFEKYRVIETSVIKTSPLIPQIINSDTSFLNVLNSQIIPEQTSTIQNLDKQISILVAELNTVCKETSPSNKENASTPEDNVIQNGEKKEIQSADNCILQRQYLQKRISATKDEKQNAEKSLVRSKDVALHLTNIFNIEASNNSNSSTSSKAAYLFVSLWLCLLIAIAFSPIIPMYAQINNYLFNREDDGELHVTNKIKESYNRNQNQPLLGILLFCLLASAVYTSKLKVSDLINSISNIANLDLLSSLPSIQLSDINNNNQDVISNSDENNSGSEEVQPAVDTSVVIPDITTQEATEEPYNTVDIIYESNDVDVAAVYTSNSFSYNTNLHEENGAPDDSYTVVVTFVVNIDGSVSDINALTNNGYGLENEIIEKISNTSGNWEPARKNGNKVRSRGRYTFKFE